MTYSQAMMKAEIDGLKERHEQMGRELTVMRKENEILQKQRDLLELKLAIAMADVEKEQHKAWQVDSLDAHVKQLKVDNEDLRAELELLKSEREAARKKK